LLSRSDIFDRKLTMASEQSFDLGKAAVAGCFISIAGLIGAGATA
jgi:hypothetical protein